MAKKKYQISWIVLTGDAHEGHEHKSISHMSEFADVEEALNWAKTRLTIEVQECSSKGKVIPLMNNLNQQVEWGAWQPTSNED
jgi:hypothetical protein